jgi:acyl-CoA synthetase (AMP-forming)/AMP-acid ligase II
LFVHAGFVATALAAAEIAGTISSERMIVIQPPTQQFHPSSAESQTSRAFSDDVRGWRDDGLPTVQTLIEDGLRLGQPQFVERKLEKGEAKTKVAFLSFSSGTTGKPKVALILFLYERTID